MRNFLRTTLIVAGCFMPLPQDEAPAADGGALGCAMAKAIYDDCMSVCNDMWEYVWDGSRLVQVYDRGYWGCVTDCRSSYNKSACAN